MNGALPAKVLITGGHRFGGVTSFAEELGEGFVALGFPVEILRRKTSFGVGANCATLRF